MKEILEKNLNIIKCNKCSKSDWEQINKKLNCKDCQNSYIFSDSGQLISVNDFINQNTWEKVATSFDLFNENSKPINVDKIGGPRISELREKFNIKGIAINLGSGQDNYPDFLNIDLGSYGPVDIVADLQDVPIINNSVDLVASNSVLEHIYNFQKVIEEVYRILSPGGYFYLCVPSACLRHHEFDFHRWTTPGLHKLLENKFEIIDSGSVRGVGYALITFVDALISYKIKTVTVKKIISSLWRFISKPLLWIKSESTEEYQAMSQTIYVIGRKI